MHKCDNCGKIFETPKEYCTEEQIFAGCPDTQCRGTYTDVFKCSLCDEWKPHDEIHKDICYECAEKEYTDRLGLKYIDKYKDFYLDAYGVEKVDKDLKSDLIDVLEKAYKESIDMDNDWNHKLARVKEYCLEFTDEWIKFLREEI